MNVNNVWRKNGKYLRSGLGAVAAVALVGGASYAYADTPDYMAPPADTGATAAPADSSSVFDWHETPANQRVPIRRAVFDQGGYQLFDTSGETIVVPFVNQNLYVMKFGRSDDGTMYFVNDGDTPVLYVPDGGYLENATVDGAKWYPFSHDWHPSHPVYVGIAPSWDDYVGMGWYPNMVCYGGYWGYDAFYPGAVFVATPGFCFGIGGSFFFGWDHYAHYRDFHPAPYHTGWWHRDDYRFAQRNWGSRSFYGAGGRFTTHGFNRVAEGGSHHAFMGAGHPYYYHGGGHTYTGRAVGTFHGSGGRGFGDGPGSVHVFRGAEGSGSGHSFGGGSSHSFGGGSHSFGGGGTFHGGDNRGGGGGGHFEGGGDNRGGGGGGHFSGGEVHGGGGGHDDRH